MRKVSCDQFNSPRSSLLSDVSKTRTSAVKPELPKFSIRDLIGAASTLPETPFQEIGCLEKVSGKKQPAPIDGFVVESVEPPDDSTEASSESANTDGVLLEELFEKAVQRLSQLVIPDEYADPETLRDLQDYVDTAWKMHENVVAECQGSKKLPTRTYHHTLIEWFLDAETDVANAVVRLQGAVNERRCDNIHVECAEFAKAQELLELQQIFVAKLEEFRAHAGKSPSGAKWLEDDAQNAIDAIGLVPLRSIKRNESVRRIRFVRTGPWSVERFKTLSEFQVEAFRGHCTIFDRHQAGELVCTVDSLNAGKLEAPEGFCIIWSTLRGRNCLLFQESSWPQVCKICPPNPTTNKGQVKARAIWQRAFARLKVQGAESRISQGRNQMENLIRIRTEAELAESGAEWFPELATELESICVDASRKAARYLNLRDDVLKETSEESRRFDIQLEHVKSELQLFRQLRGDPDALVSDGERNLKTPLGQATGQIHHQLLCFTRQLEKRVGPLLRQLQAKMEAELQYFKKGELLDGRTDPQISLCNLRETADVTSSLCESLGTVMPVRPLLQSRQKVVESIDRCLTILQSSACTLDNCRELEDEISVAASTTKECLLQIQCWQERMRMAEKLASETMQVLFDISTDKLGEPTRESSVSEKLWDAVVEGILGSLCVGGAAQPDTKKLVIAPTPAKNISKYKQGYELMVGDRVVDFATKQKYGTIRYIGNTSFALGVWAGVELDRPIGQHCGCVNGQIYFKCKFLHGVFVRPRTLEKVFSNHFQKPHPWNSLAAVYNFGIGDRVVDVATGWCFGEVQYVGRTLFAPGPWVGICLDKPQGKNNGSIDGVVYFECRPQSGLFIRPHAIRLVDTRARSVVNTSTEAVR